MSEWSTCTKCHREYGNFGRPNEALCQDCDPLVCPQCGKNELMNKDVSGVWFCDGCGAYDFTPIPRAEHEGKKHPLVYMHYCDECGNTYKYNKDEISVKRELLEDCKRCTTLLSMRTAWQGEIEWLDNHIAQLQAALDE